MTKTLGIDVGTNSVGWCLLEDGQNIIDWGVYIYPEGAIYKSGNELSKNLDRQLSRTARRNRMRFKLRRKNLRALLRKHGMLPENLSQWTAREVYGLRAKALDEKLSKEALGRVFLHLNRRRGFKSGRKDQSIEKELKGMKADMEALQKTVKEQGFRTAGEYFYSLFTAGDQQENWRNPDEPVERIRNRHIKRAFYQEEFDLICEKQKEYYPEILTDAFYQKVRDETLYYQRPLKSAKHLVNKCRFEPTKRVAPKSAPLFQEFRYWQKLADLRVTTNTRTNEPLRLHEKELIASQLQINEKMTLKKALKIIGLAPNTIINLDDTELPGNRTNTRFRNALGSAFWEQLPEGSSKDKAINGKPRLTRYLLWHTLQFYDPGLLPQYATQTLGLSPEQAEKYAKIKLEAEYGALSTKALKNILPHLKAGKDYTQACLEAGYRHSNSLTKTEIENRELLDTIPSDIGEDILSPVVKKSVKETCRLINAIVKKYGRPDSIHIELARELKKPKDVRENIRRGNKAKEELRNAYREYLENHRFTPDRISRNDLIKFELWLELEFAETDVKKISHEIDLEDFKKFRNKIDINDKEKFRLWLECGRISPYSGQVIPFNKLFSAEIQVEHIVPYSKSLDNSFTNKTLSELSLNQAKGNRLPMQYFATRSEAEKAAFIKRISHFPKAKQKKLLLTQIPEDFLPSQLGNSAQVGKEVRKAAEYICRTVRVTNGQATAAIRKAWRLNRLLNQENRDKKNRKDHRHHAIDALVIAFTTPGHIQRISRDSSFDASGKQRVPIQMPNGLFIQAKSMLDDILVPYRKEKRLLSRRPNRYRHSHAQNSSVQRVASVRGQLHEETQYGLVQHPIDRSETFVYRVAVEGLTMNQIQQVIDLPTRRLILEHIYSHTHEESPGTLSLEALTEAVKKIKNFKAALREPLFRYSKDGSKKVPVKKVRIKVPQKLTPIRRHQHQGQTGKYVYAKPGKNYCYVLYRDPESGRQEAEVLSFFEAVKRKRQGKQLFPPVKNGLPYAFMLQQNDLVLTYEESPEELRDLDRQELFLRLYRVAKFDNNLNIVFAKHNLSIPDTDKASKPDVLRNSTNTIKAIPAFVSLTGELSYHA